MELHMHDSSNCFSYFVMCASLIISKSLASYSKLQAFGKHTIIDPTCPTKVMDVFSIRFRNGDIVELVPVPATNTIETFFRLVDSSFSDGAGFSVYLRSDMVMIPPPAHFNDNHIWPEGTWLYELADIILMILNWGEAGRLSEMLTRIGDKGVKKEDMLITPPAEQPKPVVVEDIESHRTIECTDSYRTSIFNLACTTTMGDILRDHNNIKSFGTKYTVAPTNGENLCALRWYIEYADNMGIILSDYAAGDICLATVMRDGEVCIGITYQFTNPITPETEINDLCEELHRLILALLHYDTIKELKDMRGSDNYIQTMLTEKDLKNVMHETDPDNEDGESAEVIELR